MNAFTKSILSIIILAIGGIPTWMFLIAKHSLHPQGFWQNIAVYGLGFYFLCGLQFFFLIFAIILIVIVWMASN